MLKRVEVLFRIYSNALNGKKNDFFFFGIFNLGIHSSNLIYLTTAHPSCNGHSSSISVCEMWGVGGKGQGPSLQEKISYKYTLRLG